MSIKARRQIKLQEHTEPHARSGDEFSQEGASDDLARQVLTILKWRWLDETFSIEATRVLPILLLELFFAERAGRRISKKQACDIMGVDSAKTGPKYISQAEAKGLLLVDRKPEEDKRKDFLRPTPRLIDLLTAQLADLHHVIDRQRERSSMASSGQHYG